MPEPQTLTKNKKNILASLNGFLKTEKGLVYTSIGTMAASGLGGLFWLVLASLLDVESYGVVNYYIALASVFSAVALLGLDATVITFMSKGERKIWFQANSLVLVSGLITAGVLSIFQWAAGLLSIAMVFFMMTLAESLGKKQYGSYALLSVGERIVQIVLSLLLYLPFGIFGIVFGYFFGNFVFSYRYLKFLPNFSLQIDSIKEKRTFTLHSYGFNLIRNFTNWLDKIVIAPIFGYYLLGLYQLGFQFFMFLSIIPLSLYYYLLPEEASGKSKTKIKYLGFAFAVIAGVSAFFFTPYIVERLFSSFMDSILIVRVMCLAIIPQTVVSICNASLLGRGQSKSVFTAGLVYIGVLLVLLFMLGSIFGPIGLAITLIISQSTQASYLLIKYRYLKRKTGN